MVVVLVVVVVGVVVVVVVVVVVIITTSSSYCGNLQGLLSSLDYAPLVELLPLCAECKVAFDCRVADAAQLRRSYLHTIRRIHPDKLQDAKLRERTAASAIFEALRQAHERK